jgi:hypothetical protein
VRSSSVTISGTACRCLTRSQHGGVQGEAGAQGTNDYAGDSPVTASDPSGLCPADQCGV